MQEFNVFLYFFIAYVPVHSWVVCKIDRIHGKLACMVDFLVLFVQSVPLSVLLELPPLPRPASHGKKQYSLHHIHPNTSMNLLPAFY